PCSSSSLYLLRPPPTYPLFPYTTLFRSPHPEDRDAVLVDGGRGAARRRDDRHAQLRIPARVDAGDANAGVGRGGDRECDEGEREDRKSTRLNSSHVKNSYAVFCLKKKKN